MNARETLRVFNGKSDLRIRPRIQATAMVDDASTPTARVAADAATPQT